MVRTPIAVIIATLLAGPAAAHGPFDGFWAADPEWCGNDAGETDQVPIMIDLPVVRGYESQCVIDAFRRIGGGDTWETELTCSGEGETWSARAIYGLVRDPDDRPSQLVRVDLEDGFVTIFSRCD